MQLWVDAAGNPTIFPQWSKSGNGGASPVVANGIVYYAGSTGVRALDSMSGNVLWSDSGAGSSGQCRHRHPDRGL
ncbi:MAG TPA: hypothetical protein VHQ90_15235 [Thermoanaerobaculia bacterium]|nr:hypothetical protein [Thermoanaerobaculia bacterium]